MRENYNQDQTVITYERTGESTNTNALGMREMQARVYEKRQEQYLLVKAPPASGKSRAMMFVALDKLAHQGIRKVIVAVPEKSIGRSFKPTPLKKYGFFDDFLAEPSSVRQPSSHPHSAMSGVYEQALHLSSAALPAPSLLAPQDALPATGGRYTRETAPECRPIDYSMLLYSYLYLFMQMRCKYTTNNRNKQIIIEYLLKMW